MQGLSAVENIAGRPHVLNHDAVPAACFTHPEIAFVGLSEEQAKVDSFHFICIRIELSNFLFEGARTEGRV